MMFHKRITAFVCAASLLVLTACAATSTHESVGGYIDDTTVTAKVKAAIFNDANLKSSEINVETYKGAVQLSGFVGQKEDVSRAAQVVSQVKGVQSVKNDIRQKN